ncbi:hypothetical protein [Paenibacillus sp. ISL-20]|uniref:hypothetical protein n=1 Tax=Paenibacillus sp. ISL-20 TaxID=2819163 RepID=UPI001BE5DFD8|nr:hypothetical protein [Paenibacillus sp. ISL-20]MBT2759877.1 hypothetical protein [Paenibacillus sp. ISL-20]
MMNFNEMNTIQKVDYLSDTLAECITAVRYVAYHQMNQGEQLQVKQDFHQALKAENIELTDEIIKAVEEEFSGSPLPSFLREYGYTVTQSREFTEAVEKLTEGRKVTIMKFNDFGWPVVMNTVIERLEVKPYAQYKESLKIVHKPKRKRTSYYNMILPNESLMVFDGWLNIDTDKLTNNVIKDDEHVTVKQSKFGSFDKQFMADALNTVGVNPIVQISL